MGELYFTLVKRYSELSNSAYDATPINYYMSVGTWKLSRKTAHVSGVMAPRLLTYTHFCLSLDELYRRHFTLYVTSTSASSGNILGHVKLRVILQLPEIVRII